MTPETKVVLGRTFTWDRFMRVWGLRTARGYLELESIPGGVSARLTLGENRLVYISAAVGPTEAAVILALQSQLRKMAELEVEQ